MLTPTLFTLAVSWSSALGAPSSATEMLEANLVDARFGDAVAGAGDVDGDGYDDIIVGAPRAPGAVLYEGAAFLFAGSPTGVGTTPVWSAVSGLTDSWFGTAVAGAGDVNGDGYDDVVVGASGASLDPWFGDYGAAALFFGSPAGLQAAPSWTFLSPQAGAFLGISVAGAGDVNGDGFDDVVVGAPYHSTAPSAQEGLVLLFLGSATGLPSSPSWTAAGTQPSSVFGRAVASAGDVDADGYDDLIVGAFHHNHLGVAGGAAFLYQGSPSGLAATPAWVGGPALPASRFGTSVAGAGDVDGDGYDDVVIGSMHHGATYYEEGAATLYRGSAAGLSSTPSWFVESGGESAWLGYSVASAGDMNGDGYDDVVVGAPRYMVTGAFEGTAMLFVGSASGLATTPTRAARGGQWTCNFGTSVASAGDVNGDGLDDLVVGADGYDAGEPGEGAAFVFHGR